MNKEEADTARFFVGGEVEYTPAYSKRTLFVVGHQPASEIITNAREASVSHIFMGANHSFKTHEDLSLVNTYWNDTILKLLVAGYLVTLEYEAHTHKDLLLILCQDIWASHNFIPLLSVRIPNIETSNENLTIKLDDVGFDATNRGVWCMNYREITDSNRFTGWGEYKGDKVMGGPAARLIPSVLMPIIKDVVPESLFTEELNNSELGLDIHSASLLKADPDEKLIDPKSSPKFVLEAYASGATKDPLGEVVKSKGRVKK